MVTPEEELSAMRLFYGGKKCVVCADGDIINWAPMLDASFEPSNKRVSKSQATISGYNKG
jgi:hypothetical protein